MYLQKFDLSGRRAVVTGGAQGIGAACADALAEAGASVVIADLDLALAEENPPRSRLRVAWPRPGIWM